MNVLVTGVGGGVGQSIVKSLQDTPYTVIGVDSEVLGAGLYAVARGYHGPRAADADYVDRLVEICRAEGCALLFPGLDVELPVLARNAERFRAVGTIPVVSSPAVVDLCDDKLATSRFLSEQGFPGPRTWTLSEWAAGTRPVPVVLKPRRGGARSRGVHRVRDDSEARLRLASLPDEEYVAQEEIAGDEFTCGSLNRDGRCLGTIVMRRILRDGDTYKAFVHEDPALHDFVRRVLEALRPFGPCNVQLRVRDGVPHVFEFNARCSGTTFCRTLAGFNEPRMMADLLLHGTAPSYRIRPLTILRYWKELVVENERVTALAERGRVEGGPARL